MNWKDEKTISVYDLSNQETQNSGDISIHTDAQKDSIKHRKFSINRRKLSENVISIPNENLLELRTKPSKSLIFSPSYNSIDLKLYNDNSFPILFKLKTTQPDIIASQPARGFIQAHSFIQCHLTPIEFKYRLLLVVQYARILNQYDDYITQWKNLKIENIHLKKFQCLCQDEKENILRKQTLFKPIILTFATITLLTTFIYFRNKSF